MNLTTLLVIVILMIMFTIHAIRIYGWVDTIVLIIIGNCLANVIKVLMNPTKET